jgi:hypothetical protein
MTRGLQGNPCTCIFSEGSLLLKMTRQKGTISIFIAEIE